MIDLETIYGRGNPSSPDPQGTREPRGVTTYTTLAGEWGWVCADCRAESRYVYGDRHKAARLGRAHARYCRGRRPRKGSR